MSQAKLRLVPRVSSNQVSEDLGDLLGILAREFQYAQNKGECEGGSYRLLFHQANLDFFACYDPHNFSIKFVDSRNNELYSISNLTDINEAGSEIHISNLVEAIISKYGKRK